MRQDVNHREVFARPETLGEDFALILDAFAGSPGVSLASLWGMLGAADALSQAAVAGEITQQAARDELFRIIVDMVKHARPRDK